MMTAKKVERITRCTVKRIDLNQPNLYQFLLRDENGQSVCISNPYHWEADSLNHLVNVHYALQRDRAFRRQGYRCFHCGHFRPLECDHVKPRARGERLDTLENLRGLCHDHHVAHTDNKMTPTIHPQVADIAAKEGWQWAGEKTGWIRISQ